MGLGMVAVGASVMLSHIAETDQRQLVIAMAAGGAFAAFALPALWHKHRFLAVTALVGVICGEAYGYAQTVERILGVREERSRTIAAENQTRQMIEAQVERFKDELAEAKDAAAKEAENGGCKKECIRKEGLVEAARQRLADAEKSLAATPPVKAEAKLATKLGVGQDLVDIVLAGMVSLSLLLFQLVFLAVGHPDVEPEAAPAKVQEPSTIDPALPRTKHEEAAEFARAYRAKHGRPPAWAEVHKAGFSPATASRALRLVK